MAAGMFPKDVEILFKRIYKNKTIPSIIPGSKQMRLGYPVMFVYSAKWKSKLPFWDSLPFSVVIARYPDGFLGLNLHYIEWTKRLQLAEKLVRASKNKKRITYAQIRSAWDSLRLPVALLMLTIRRYLYSHIRSKMKVFDWETYRGAVQDIRPKFMKESERRILAAIRAKWALHMAKTRGKQRK